LIIPALRALRLCAEHGWIWWATMNLQVTGMTWSRLTRVLSVLGVVAGVFVMHGLTGNHDAAMAAAHMNAAPRAVVVPAAGHGASQADHARATTAALATERLGDAGHVITAVVRPAGDEHIMASACVAVLTALVLLLALALALRSLLAWRRVQLIAPSARPVVTGRSPPWVVPSLSKLCVLRT
jgi:hypothetical protein